MIQNMCLSYNFPIEGQCDFTSIMTLILKEREISLSLTKEIISEKQKCYKLEQLISSLSMKLIGIREETDNGASEADEKVAGEYSAYIRRQKIKKYKLKKLRHRAKVKISREFKGRSIAAKLKPRYNGKFAKKSFQD